MSRAPKQHPWQSEFVRGQEHVYPLTLDAARRAPPETGPRVDGPHPKCVLCVAGICRQVMLGESVCHELDIRLGMVSK